ncbi:putative nucleic acid binding protein 29 [Elsinoe australis]|uniref:Putative nucleic acid binding protein 29 n=1 Tax=Elsinoe australis TaxID=40998 RepID=A0A4U7AR05_9PEZI|nr:putative nucleic acid binding protein 29 [Elsinoe australis]
MASPGTPSDPRGPQSGNARAVSFDTKSPRIESWTIEQTANLLASTNLDSPATPARTTSSPRGTSAPLSIPLDTPSASPAPAPGSVPRALFPSNLPVSPSPAPAASATASPAPPREEPVHVVHRRREPIRRDSQKRREALLKGKEGSRRRQRWENDRLLHVPGAQAPLPGDWAVPCWEGRGEMYRPVPYFLAPLWEGKYKDIRREREEAERRERLRRGLGERGLGAGLALGSEGVRGREEMVEVDGVDEKERRREARKRVKEEEELLRVEMEKEQVARDLRARIKKARGARGLLQDLELEVRNFLMQLEIEERNKQGEDKDGFVDVKEDSDEEIVFIGRNGGMSEKKKRSASEGERMERLIFQSLERDHGASFGRWLVHSIANYYGLETWSITTGNPARREAYVGLKPEARPEAKMELPRPLWVIV